MNNFFSQKNILVIGDVILDCYEYGEVSRISAEAPVPIVHLDTGKKTMNAGGAANVAMNIRGLGANCFLIGRVGGDEKGKILKKTLTDHDIKFVFISEKNIGTITKTRIISQNQQMLRLDEESIHELEKDSFIKLRDSLIAFIDICDIIIISDYAKGFCSEELCIEIIIEAKKRDKIVLVDPKGESWYKYQGAFLMAPNLKELSEFMNKKILNEDSEIGYLGEQAYLSNDIDHLLITRSEKGVTLIDSIVENHYPSKAQEVYDVSGAGDTLIAVLAACLAKKIDLKDSIDIAVAACAIVVAKLGTVPINLEELMAQQCVIDILLEYNEIAEKK